MRLMVGGNLDPNELEALLDYELETHHKEAHEPAHAVQGVADALPGFGIVAAVLGIVNTMAAVADSTSAELGAKVGAALVGTLSWHPRLLASSSPTASSAPSPRP